jgi:hypothetical protein
VGTRQGGRKKVAVEFADGRGDFWHVYAPLINLKQAVQGAKADA